MCRWMAWLGQPVLIEELLFNSRTGSSTRAFTRGWAPSRRTATASGWAGTATETAPAVYRSVAPAWSDANLRELAGHVESPLFLTHVSAAIGSPVQETNCHPFRHGRWLFVHNGFIADFHVIRRDLMLAIDPALFAEVQGSTDTEVVFYLALTFGLEDDPIRALERTVGFVESVAGRHGVDGCRSGRASACRTASDLWAVRYATEARRVRCSPRPTWTRCGACTPTTPGFSPCGDR